MNPILGFVAFVLVLWATYRISAWYEYRRWRECPRCLTCSAMHGGHCCDCGRALPDAGWRPRSDEE